MSEWFRRTLEVRRVVPDIIKLMTTYFAKNSKGTLKIPYASAGLAE